MASYSQKIEDILLICPYNPHHKVARRRFDIHVSKCEKDPKNPKLKTCPYNYTHRIDPALYEAHVAECPESARFVRELAEIVKITVNKQNQQPQEQEAKEQEPPKPKVYSEPPTSISTSPNNDDDDDGWNTPSSEQPTYIAPGLIRSKSKGTGYNPLSYQNMKPAERRAWNQKLVAETLAEKQAKNQANIDN